VTALPQTLGSGQAVDWDEVERDLAPIACERREQRMRRLSRDYYWFSPILKPQLDTVIADIVVTPTSVAELETVVAYCVDHRLPLTPRGAATGNYGQAMPLFGGVLVDLRKLDKVLWIKDGVMRVQGGIKLYDAGQAALEHGYELRLFPSTWKQATVGGFIAGGTTGFGAIGYGTLHDAGNVLALKVLTAQEQPELVELRGAAAQAAVHAYGTSGIIVEAEIALAPARRWHDRIIAMPDLAAALDGAGRIGAADIAKRELALLDTGITAKLPPVAGLLDAPAPVLIVAVDEPDVDAFDALVADIGGTVVFARSPDAPAGKMPPLYELCWNHTTLHALSADPELSYLQLGFSDDWAQGVLAVADAFGEDLPMHLEFAWTGGKLACFGIPLLKLADAGELAKVHARLAGLGCGIFSPHTFVLETGGMQVADPQQEALRQISDPRAILNPGKLPAARPSGIL